MCFCPGGHVGGEGVRRLEDNRLRRRSHRRRRVRRVQGEEMRGAASRSIQSFSGHVDRPAAESGSRCSWGLPKGIEYCHLQLTQHWRDGFCTNKTYATKLILGTKITH
ncbi:hypothetical protein NDU88_000954 [Pleurodeles waltl]|uniref:Uncharacterized protein n=1 Tax=Pleurodeles waltl TaxID=8319 RepID=A0AAV7S770_PLEWA|nr:hypothetical protein NDU88_000954 [Pleurodeles waltl]